MSEAKYTAIFSGKGGVGKTTTAVNLGLALHNNGEEVIVVDSNLCTPNLALQLGLAPNPHTLHSVLKGKSDIQQAIQTHETGLKIVPASLSLSDSINYQTRILKKAIAPLEEEYDFIIMDCGAGLYGDVLQVVKMADEALIVTNPELPAAVDALKCVKLAERLGVDIRGIVLNKFNGNRYEMDEETLEGVLRDYPIIARIPFDKNVPKSIARRVPIVDYKPRSPASRGFKALAQEYNGGSARKSWLDWFRFW